MLNGTVVSAEDRVACIAARGSWIVLGKISAVASGGGGSSGGFAGNIYTIPEGSAVPATQPGDLVLYYEA